MFEKLTPRERMLSYAVIGLVPLALGFVGVFWFIGKYTAVRDQEVALSREIDDEEFKMAQAKKADRRRAYYDSISFPVDIENASNDYQSWMKGLVRDELKMNFKSLTPVDASDLKDDSVVIGKRRGYTLRADGTLNQLTSFLNRFYSVELFHRINSLQIIALNEVAGSDKKVRTGQLSITVKVEVLSLNTAPHDPDFIARFNSEAVTASKLAETNKTYQDLIKRRDIFGPPNNTPTVAASPSNSYTSMSDAQFAVTGKDADEEDELTFELIESSVEGATLEPVKPGERASRILVPGQKAGRYDFQIKVTDSGFPPKESIEKFAVNFKDPVVVKKEPDPEPDPPYINAKETLITGIVLENTGDWRVWIKVRTTGDKYKLKVGESFELDEQKWVVEEISPHEAVLRVKNKLLTFRPTDRFINPRHEVILEVPVADDASEPVEKGAKVKLDVDAETDTAPKPRATEELIET